MLSVALSTNRVTKFFVIDKRLKTQQLQSQTYIYLKRKLELMSIVMKLQRLSFITGARNNRNIISRKNLKHNTVTQLPHRHSHFSPTTLSFSTTSARDDKGIQITKSVQNNDSIVEKEQTSTCSQGIPDDLEDDSEELEEMFVKPDVSLGHNQLEWGGPRRLVLRF